MAWIRGFAVTEEASNVTSLPVNMPVHQANDLLLVFANKDGTAVVDLPAGYTNIQSVASAGAANRWCRKIAASNAETLTLTTGTTDSWTVVVVAIAEVDTTTPILVSAVAGADDTAMPFDSPATTTTSPEVNTLVFYSFGTDSGLSPTAYQPLVNLYNGDNTLNSMGVAYTVLRASGIPPLRTFFGRANDDGRGCTIVIKNAASPTRIEAYSDPVESVATMVRALVGAATTESDSWPGTLSPNIIGNDFSSVQRDNAGAFTDVTTAMNNGTAADVTWAAAINNAMYFGAANPFTWVAFNISTAGTTGTLAWEYWNGAAWVTLSPLNTLNLTATGSQAIRWGTKADWATTTVNGVSGLFWIRARQTVAYVTTPVFTQGRKDGMGTTFDAVAASGDAGTNPYTDATRLSPAQSTTGLGGSELLFGAAQDLDTGILLMTTRPILPRDAAVDIGSRVENPYGAGLLVNLMDTNQNYLAYGIMARGALDYDIDGRNVHAIDWNGAATPVSTRGAVNKSAVTRMQLVCHPRAGQVDLDFSMLAIVQKMCIAGGTSANPLTFEQYFNALNKSCGYFPFGRLAGDAVTVFCPLQIGGGDGIAVSFNLKTIQFPRRYDGINYFAWNAADNVAGIIFEGKAGDVISFTNCVFTSPSKYRWEWDAAASASATYDFDGASVVNATVTLRSVYTFNNMTFIDCSTFTQNGATITNSAFQGSTVTSGNPAVLSDNTFAPTASATSQHGIVITAAGTYSFDGNIFTGYKPTQFGFNTGTDVSSANDTVTRTAHGYATGDLIEYRTRGGVQAIGLTDATTYFVRAVDANTLAFYTTAANAVADTSRINLTSGGSETHTIASMKAAIYNNSGGVVTLNITGGGSTPSIRNGASATTTVNANVSVTLTNLQNPSEVRVFDAGTETERSGTGAENVTTGTHVFTLPSGTSVDISILSLGFQNTRILAYSTTSDASIPVSQVVDRQYLNP